MARATSRRRVFGSRRTALRNGSDRSICNVGFQIAREALDSASLARAGNLFVHPLNETIEFSFGHTILLKRIIIGVNGDWPKRDDLVAMENADVFTIGGPLQQRGQIGAGTGRRERCHESILRRYGEQLNYQNHYLVASRKNCGMFRRSRMAALVSMVCASSKWKLL